MRKVPKEGFKTITVKEKVYDYFYKKWKENETRYQVEHGITSFAGFVSWLLNRMLEQEEKDDKMLVSRFEYLRPQEGKVVISDRKLGLSIEVSLQPDGKFWCEYCKKEDCEHVRFVANLQEIQIIQRLRERKKGLE